MKDSTPNPTITPTAAAATTSTSPKSPSINKEKSTTNTVFRDTRAELAQLLKKKEEIEVCSKILRVLFFYQILFVEISIRY